MSVKLVFIRILVLHRYQIFQYSDFKFLDTIKCCFFRFLKQVINFFETFFIFIIFAEYEVAFDKFATNGLLQYNDIKEFFKSVGHTPSQKEIDDAIELVTKSKRPFHVTGEGGGEKVYSR